MRLTKRIGQDFRFKHPAGDILRQFAATIKRKGSSGMKLSAFVFKRPVGPPMRVGLDRPRHGPALLAFGLRLGSLVEVAEVGIVKEAHRRRLYLGSTQAPMRALIRARYLAKLRGVKSSKWLPIRP